VTLLNRGELEALAEFNADYLHIDDGKTQNLVRPGNFAQYYHDLKFSRIAARRRASRTDVAQGRLWLL